GVGVHDVHALERNAERPGDANGQRRLGPLADLARPGDQRDAAEVVDLDDGAAAIGAIDPRAAAHVEHARIADAALEARRQRRGDAANLVADRIEALPHGARGHDEALAH